MSSVECSENLNMPISTEAEQTSRVDAVAVEEEEIARLSAKCAAMEKELAKWDVKRATRLEEMAALIDAKLPKTKLFARYKLTLHESNADIVSSLSGEMRNMVLTFFKGGCFKHKKCDHCGTTEAKQYDRAHDKSVARDGVALAALARIRPDESAPVSQQAFMRAFVNEHRYVPVWYLCKPCHRLYDA
jgi:hypothetical protein